MKTDYQMLIQGEWVDSSSGDRLLAINPFNQEVWATIPQASDNDVDRAIYAACGAFEHGWRDTNGLERARLMTQLADLLEDNASWMTRLETTDNGKLLRENEAQIRFAARNYRFFAGYADKLYGETIPLDNPNLFDYTVREPVGVAALVTAWNAPMQILANKLAPALAAGNTVVIKPSEHASATTLEFGSLAHQAGFPDGVINIVTGDGNVGSILTKSPFVDKISITGGAQTGRVIANNASHNLVPVTLELGGKSPNIIFEDADLKQAITGALAGVFGAGGQSCISGSRLLVQNSVYDEVVSQLTSRTEAITLGNPLDSSTEMGPAANEAQYKQILHFIESGVKEGATLTTGGEPFTEGELGDGFFISPAIFTDVDNKMTIAQEEVFGPVMSIISFDSEEQAMEIANDTRYGLASGVWTQDVSRVQRVSRQLRAGTVWVNTYRTTAAQAPFGGTKQSGYGRERGRHALEEYTYVKNVLIDYSGETRDPFSIRT